jgi:sugar phosphate isomerase/epimerase
MVGVKHGFMLTGRDEGFCNNRKALARRARSTGTLFICNPAGPLLRTADLKWLFPQLPDTVFAVEKKVARIVGKNPRPLDAENVFNATVETVADNTVDGLMNAGKQSHTDRFPDLPKSFRAVFPFKLAVPSFVYPEGYVFNVAKLGRFVDEIELLFLEGRPADGLPGPEVIDRLARLSRELELSYDIHLPIDIHPAGRDETLRHEALKTIGRVIDACAPLAPTSYTLHVPMEESTAGHRDIHRWQAAATRSISKLLDRGVHAHLLAIETLDYPFHWIEPVIAELGLSVCVDFGHLALSGQDLEGAFKRNFNRIAIVHLHGFDAQRDHLALDRIDRVLLEQILEWISAFAGTVSLEVFSYADLRCSLQILEEFWAARKRF